MIQEFVCTRECVHDRHYVVGKRFVGEEKDLPHNTAGELIHFKLVEKGLVENAISAEIEAMKRQIEELQAQAKAKVEPKQQEEVKEVVIDAGEEVALPTNGQIKARLDELDIPWKAPMNKTQLLALLPEGTVFTLADGATWMKE